MKHFFTIAFILAYTVSFAQNDALYLSFDEYQNNKPTFVLNKNNGDKVKYAFPAGMQNRLKIKQGDKTSKLKSDDVWGYMKDCVLYRRFDYKQRDMNWEYQRFFRVVEQDEDYVFYKTVQGDLYSEYQVYYYSKSLNSDIKPANETNLKNDFFENNEIIEAIVALKK